MQNFSLKVIQEKFHSFKLQVLLGQVIHARIPALQRQREERGWLQGFVQRLSQNT
jgi:hypothetical protein